MSEQVVEESQVTPEQQAQDESNALAAGYNKVRGEPAKVEEAEPKEPVSETKEEPKEVQVDPWAGVPDIVRQSIEKVSITANQIGAAQRHIKTLEGNIEALKAAGQAAQAAAPSTAPTQSQIQAAAASGEKWKQIKEDFPDWAEAMEERLAAQVAASNPSANVDVDGLRKEWAQNTQAQVAGAIDVAEERAYLRFKYPTWKADVNTPDFIGWMKTQAPEIKALAESNLADDAIRMLDAYSEHQKAAATKAAAEAKNQQRLASNIAPKQAASGGPTILPDEAGLSIGYNRVKRRA